MGKCERCGFRRWRLSRTRCMVCGAALCENRQMVAGYANDHVTGSARPPESTLARPSLLSPYHTVCSWECFDRWAWTFISRGHAPAVLGQQYVLGGIRLHPGTAGRTVAPAEDFRRTQKLAQVRNLTEADRPRVCGRHLPRARDVEGSRRGPEDRSTTARDPGPCERE